MNSSEKQTNKRNDSKCYPLPSPLTAQRAKSIFFLIYPNLHQLTYQSLPTGKGNKMLTLEEQLVLLDDASAEVALKEPEGKRIVDMGDNVVKSLSASSSSKPKIESQLKDMKAKWKEIQGLVGDRRKKLERAMAEKRVRDQLKALDDTLGSFKRWLDDVEEIDDGSGGDSGGGGENADAAKISLQLDQCKVKLKSLLSHDDKVASLFADAGTAFSSEKDEASSGLQEELVTFKAR